MRHRLCFVAALIAAAVLTGCGGADVQTNPIKPGQPPENMNWDGVWFSNWGRMELTQNGNQIEGIYEGERKRGQVKGELDGDLLRYEWKEWDLSLRGKPRETSGHGIYQYKLVEEGSNMKEHIDGTWGYDKSDMGGGKWSAVKSSKSPKKLKPFDPNAAEAAAAEEKAAAGFVQDEGAGQGDQSGASESDEGDKTKDDSDIDL